jgi:hypothetical protein
VAISKNYFTIVKEKVVVKQKLKYWIKEEGMKEELLYKGKGRKD